MLLKINNFFRQNRELILILLAASILFFYNLGNMSLWEDEAETAVLAKNILKTGLPHAWDGKNIVTQEFGRDSNNNNIWIYHPWLSHYISALSMKIIGTSNWALRFPFTLFGFLTIPLLYSFSLFISKNKRIAVHSSLLLAFSIQFILYSRQLRYYSLTAFFSTLLLYSYTKLIMFPKKRYIFGTILSLILLFYSNHITAIAIGLGIFIHYLIFNRNKINFNTILAILILSFAFTLPWLMFSNASKHIEISSITIYISKFIHLLLDLNMIFPIVFIIILSPFIIKNKLKEEQWLLIIPVLSLIITYSFIPVFPRGRYLVPVYPLLFTGIAWMILKFKENSTFYIATLTFLLFTNIFSLIPGLILKNIPHFPKEISKIYFNKIKYYYNDYVHELTKKYDGPIEGIVRFLKNNANPNQTIFVNYEAEPIIFYTDLKVLRIIPFLNPPDWIVLRKNKISPYADDNYDFKCVLLRSIFMPQKIKWNSSPSQTQDDLNIRHNKKYIKHILNKYNYLPIELPYPNIPYENLPDIEFHQFETVKNAPNLIIYKRINYKEET